ncbi:HNH endonuclease [Asanoa ferruginea]|uniref:HNH endonuclease n=1 Tax=Asanoa ferruginea TaxID=53367 RepID=UPI0011C1054B|nr:HNH endonuclease [Asanoa ferruginea]
MTEVVVSGCAGARGRRIRRETVVRLIASGAGYCYKPDCPVGFLWQELDDGTVVKLAEVAHIVAAGEDGPRGDAAAKDEDLTSFANLLLLCPNCHSVVDRAPNQYPVETLQQWKQQHEDRIRDVLGLRSYSDRGTLRRDVGLLLSENSAIWDMYGPESEAALRGLGLNTSAAWRREVLLRILPNNTRIIRLLEANLALLHRDELETLAAFRLHARGLEDRHLGGVVNPVAPRFPRAMNDILVDDGDINPIGDRDA